MVSVAHVASMSGGRDGCWCVAWFLLFTQSRTLVHWASIACNLECICLSRLTPSRNSIADISTDLSRRWL